MNRRPLVLLLAAATLMNFLPTTTADAAWAQACSASFLACADATLEAVQVTCNYLSDRSRSCFADWTLSLSTSGLAGSAACGRAWAPAYDPQSNWRIDQVCGGDNSIQFRSYHNPEWFADSSWSQKAKVCSSVQGKLESCVESASVYIYFYYP